MPDDKARTASMRTFLFDLLDGSFSEDGLLCGAEILESIDTSLD